MSDIYSSKDIQTLEYPICVQRRLGMYLGEPSKDNKTPGQSCVAIREILDNSITEVIKGYGDNVRLTLEKDGTVIVEDNGRGIPTDYDEKAQKNGIEKSMATLHSGGSFSDQEDEKVGASLHGVGGAAVCAIASLFKVEVIRKGKLYTEVFENGTVLHPLVSRRLVQEDFLKNDPRYLKKDIDPEKAKGTRDTSKEFKKRSGSRVTFKLNQDFLSDYDTIVVDDIVDRMRYIVYVVDNLSIDIYDKTRTKEEGGGEYHFKNEGGIAGMLDFISKGGSTIQDKGEYEQKGIFHLSTKGSYTSKFTELVGSESKVKTLKRTVPIDVAIRFNDNETTDIRSFANTIRTINGGVHEEALKQALVDTFGKLAK